MIPVSPATPPSGGLKPCPFCGNAAGVFGFGVSNDAVVRCNTCHAAFEMNSPHREQNIQRAIDAWNSRAHPAPQADAWIACSERMPPHGRTVIVYIQRDSPGDWYMKSSALNTHNAWYDIPMYQHQPIFWQPLPTPPSLAALEAGGGQ